MSNEPDYDEEGEFEEEDAAEVIEIDLDNPQG